MPDVVGELNIVIDSAQAISSGDLGQAAQDLEMLKESMKGMPVARIKSLGEAMKSLSIGNIEGLSRLSDGVARLHDAMNGMPVQRLSKLMETIAQFGTLDTLPTTAKNISAFASSMERLKQAISQFGQETGLSEGQLKKALSGLYKEGDRLWVQLAKATKTTDKARKSNFALGRSFVRLARTMAIRAVIRGVVAGLREGVQNLTRFSQQMNNIDISQAANTMNSYATSFTYLKNSIGAAAMPILNALVPAFKMLAGWIATAFNYLNMFVEALKGNTMYTAAKEASVDYAASLDKANGSAKKLKKTLLGFDEINILNGKDNGGGGSGSADAFNVQDAFENRQIDSSIKEFADRLRGIVENSGIVEAFERLKEAWDTFQNYEWVKQLKVLIGKVTTSVFKDSVEAVRDVLNLASAILEGNWKDTSIYALGLLLQSVFNPLFTIMQAVSPLLDKVHGTNTSDIFDKLANVDLTNDVAKPLVDGFQKIFKWAGKVKGRIGEFFGLLKDGDTREAAQRLALFTQSMLFLFQQIKISILKKVYEAIRDIAKVLGWKSVQKWAEGKLLDLDNEQKELDESIDKFQKYKDSLDKAASGKDIDIDVNLKGADTAINKLKEIATWELKLSGTHLKFGMNSAGDTLKIQAYNKQGKPINYITQYASGGFPDVGEIYIARENGSEMVGRIGNSSAVANNDQIVEAVSRGVASAVRSVLGNGSNGGQATNIYVDGEKLFNVMVNRNNETVRTTGASPLMV